MNPRPTRFWALAVLAIVALVGLSSCSNDDSATTDAATTTSTTAPVELIEPPTVTNAGSAPKSALRLRFDVGDEALVDVVTDLRVDQTIDGRRQRLDTPPITQRIAYRVRTIDTGSNGSSATIDLDVQDVAIAAEGTDLSEAEAIELQAALDPIEGLRGTTTIDELGRATSSSFERPAELAPDADALLDSLARELPAIGPALPLEPVGIGATWVSTSTGTPDNPTVTTTTVTLTALEGERATYTSTVVIEAPLGPMDLESGEPAEGAGVNARLVATDVSGSAEGAMDLTGLGFEVRGTTSGTQTIEVTTEAGVQVLDQELMVAVRSEPAAP